MTDVEGPRAACAAKPQRASAGGQDRSAHQLLNKLQRTLAGGPVRCRQSGLSVRVVSPGCQSGLSVRGNSGTGAGMQDGRAAHGAGSTQLMRGGHSSQLERGGDGSNRRMTV